MLGVAIKVLKLQKLHCRHVNNTNINTSKSIY